MGALLELTDEERECFLIAHCRGLSIAKARDALYAEHSKARKYGVQSFKEYLKTEDGIFRREELLEKVREAAVKRSYANHGSRVDALIQNAQRLQEQLLSDDLAPKDRSMLSAEFRNHLALIKDETDVFASAMDREFLTAAQLFFKVGAEAAHRRLEAGDG